MTAVVVVVLMVVSFLVGVVATSIAWARECDHQSDQWQKAYADLEARYQEAQG